MDMEEEEEEDAVPTIDFGSLIDVVFSWSIKDVLNKDIYKDKVKQILKTFYSTICYMKSFVFPLIEETRADLCSSMERVSSAPTCEILSIEKHEDYEPSATLFYNIMVESKKDIENDIQTYEPETGDLIALTDVRPKCVDDLNRPIRSYLIALVERVRKENDIFKALILLSKPIDLEQDMHNDMKKDTLFAVFLINTTTYTRIWKALSFGLDGRNVNIIKNVLQPDSAAGNRCRLCLKDGTYRVAVSKLGHVICPFNLNESQKEAVMECIATQYCHHESAVKLIWGPPGTGKTKTVAVLLYALLGLKCRTVACAPTNVAVLEVTTRLLRLVLESLEYVTYGLGDIVLLGNRKRMRIDDQSDLLNIFLDYRVKILAKCFAPMSGWKNCLEYMISLLEDPEEQYRLYLRNEKENDEGDDDEEEEEEKEKNVLGKGWLQCSEDKQEDLYFLNLKDMNDKIIWTNAIAQTLKRDIKKIKWNGKVPTGKEKHSKYEKKENQDHLLQVENKMNFEEFVKEKFNSKRELMKSCVVNLLTHLPTCCISLGKIKSMTRALNLLEYLGTSLHSGAVAGKGLKEVLNEIGDKGQGLTSSTTLCMAGKDCLQTLRSLRNAFFIPNFFDEYSIKLFCLENACLFFCTASSTAKLHITSMEMLVVDEAAQLKECESAISLQLHGLRHAILIGDERQLPALVKSKISEDAEFGRSLFERLVLLGYKKNLLDLQYRMHPAISLFPNREFYQKCIVDAPNVKEKDYQRHFLKGDMYGSYSFINVAFGNEEVSDGHSLRNMVEVAVISEVVANLFKESIASKQRVSVGVISPYNAQVFAIQEKLGTAYSTDAANDFSVSVRSIDGFQGGEEDVIIISSVRCNGSGSVGFLSNRQRANVALTRARYSLWIVGNGATLRNSGSVWKKLITDAKIRGCFHNAHEDKSLAKAIIAALVDIDQIDISLNIDSLLFREARWKVFFYGNFWKSMEKIKSIEIRKEALSLLTKLSNGWRHPCKEESLIVMDGMSAQLLELYKVHELLHIVWTVDILEENSNYAQVLKIWDILPLSEIPNLAKHLDHLFQNYTVDIMHLCKFKCTEGNLKVPMTWPVNSSSVRKIRFPEIDPVHLLCSQFAAWSLKDEVSATNKT